ncbi:uncharacterized protein A1O5_12431 [Cladophialophora psammophila CBS 110553]|uniref:Uncharacterized protein n=1 Tax=Cladophialophora psammophila CBS 110553 TaxID=1182543 RepID=W9VQR4_9EURO|nr:uncharacterized protein A1O5_12431 [Cladophialophora psammophila CBS 110553]EXJ57873.1 hypothetical protein A1O5_12431 [Cladophialophora psammophila CBS 110553]
MLGRLILVSIFLGPVMGIFDLGFFPSLFRSQKGAILPNDERVNIPSCPPQTFNDMERHNPRNGSIVFSYPSTGGILVRSAGPVELEDEFCKRFGRIGPQWWATKAELMDAELGEGSDAAKKKLAKRVETGWPSSRQGVWVLEYDLEDRAHYELRMGASLLNNCLNMDERCKIIEDLGGTFYSNPDDSYAVSRGLLVVVKNARNS